MLSDENVLDVLNAFKEELTPQIKETPGQAGGAFRHSMLWVVAGREEIFAEGTAATKKAARKVAARDLIRQLQNEAALVARVVLRVGKMVACTLKRALGAIDLPTWQDAVTGKVCMGWKVRLKNGQEKQWEATGEGASLGEAEARAWLELYEKAKKDKEAIIGNQSVTTAAATASAAPRQAPQRLPQQQQQQGAAGGGSQRYGSYGYNGGSSYASRFGGGAEDSLLSQAQAGEIMSKHNYFVQRYGSTANGLACEWSVDFCGVSGCFKARLTWKWFNMLEKRTQVAETTGYSASKRGARAEAAKKMLEDQRLITPLSAEHRSRSERIKSMVTRGDLATALQAAADVIGDSNVPTDAWSLFLLPLWRAVLASRSSSSLDAVLHALSVRTVDRATGAASDSGVPAAVWEQLLDECCCITDFSFGTTSITRLLKEARAEAWECRVKAEKWAHWRGLLAMERQALILHSFTETRALGSESARMTVDNLAMPLLTVSTSRYVDSACSLDSLVLLSLLGNFNEADSVLGTLTKAQRSPFGGGGLDSDGSGGKLVCTIKLAGMEAQQDARGESSGFSATLCDSKRRLFGATEVDVLFLEDTDISYVRMNAALRALYGAPADPSVPQKNYYFTDEIRAALLPDEAIRDLQQASGEAGDSYPRPGKVMPGEWIRGWSLTDAQHLAVMAGMNERVSLIQGPPGTGKTYTACAIIDGWRRNSVSGQGKILAVADSNAAADNMKELLMKYGIPAVRVGRAKFGGSVLDVSPEVLSALQGTKIHGEWCRATEASSCLRETGQFVRDPKIGYLRQKLDQAAIAHFSVVIATCIGSGHELLDETMFDRVVIDECTQAIEPSSLVPLARGCRQLVMIGDHKQLPATVNSSEAAGLGLGTSLFERLLNEHKGVCLNMLDIQRVSVSLHQRRMHPSISAFPNRHFYDGRLVDCVAPTPPIPGFPWPNEEVSRVCLVKTDSAGWEAREQRVGTSKRNVAEAELIVDTVTTILDASKPLSKEGQSGAVEAAEIGVVVPYNAQKALILRLFDDRVNGGLMSREEADAIHVNTVDGFQGHEKDLILFSSTRSNPSGALGFLTEPRRMNVMLTRARRGLIVFADVQTIARDPHSYWALWTRWVELEMGSAMGLQEYLHKMHLNKPRKTWSTSQSAPIGPQPQLPLAPSPATSTPTQWGAGHAQDWQQQQAGGQWSETASSEHWGGGGQPTVQDWPQAPSDWPAAQAHDQGWGTSSGYDPQWQVPAPPQPAHPPLPAQAPPPAGSWWPTPTGPQQPSWGGGWGGHWGQGQA